MYLESNFCAFYFYGIGSYPPGLSGWQRNNLFSDNNIPFVFPNFIIASMAYDEHVGKNLHVFAGRNGEINF